MKPNALASKINGMDLDDFPSELGTEAKRAGLVVVLGVSSDMVAFYGALQGEADVPGGDVIYLDRDGILPHIDDVEQMPEAEQRIYYERKKFALAIDAERDCDGYKWTFQTIIPHHRFVVQKDGARYCRAIVFRLSALG